MVVLSPWIWEFDCFELNLERTESQARVTCFVDSRAVIHLIIACLSIHLANLRDSTSQILKLLGLRSDIAIFRHRVGS